MKLDNRLWILVTTVVCGAVLAGAWFLGASPFVASAQAASDTLASATSANDATAAQISQLKATRTKMPELTAELDKLRAQVPSSVAGTDFISEVNSLASSSQVAVKSITLGLPTAYAAPAAPAGSTPAATTGATASPSASPSATATPTAAAAPTGPTAPATTVDGLITASNFVIVPITIDVEGSADAGRTFLSSLQHGNRLVLITGVTSTAQENNTVTLSLTGSIYVLKSTTTTASGSTSSNG